MTRVIVTALLLLSAVSAFAQDSQYSSDDLKKRKKISESEWNTMQERTQNRSQQFVSTNSGDASVWGQQGYTVLKINQSLDLKSEVNAVFESMASAGQKTDGAKADRKRYAFKIGPGKFEIKDGVVKRVQ
ncbi:hypothetical protein K1X84_07185 [bacterium]|nr:hypothetical protein [bacterium]